MDSGQLESGDPRAFGGGRAIAVLTDRYPELSETFVVNEVRELARQGLTVSVEATQRPDRPAPAAGGAGGAEPAYLEDDRSLQKLRGLTYLAIRHPAALLRDLRSRRRWRREEPVRTIRGLAARAARLRARGVSHLHVHFAAGAALDAMRLAAITGLPYSVTAHAYEIFAEPANLAEKLTNAAFVTTGCDYNVEYLRRQLAAEAADRVHRVVMGVDGDEFRRDRPYPGGRRVLAVGRLVEKKGFADLLEAVALLERRAPIDRLCIVGDGALGPRLRARAAELGVGDRVEFAGSLGPEAVREQLRRADLLAMPCVVAADGDRDSMPVVVKEALAMEVPVVASDEVGLPELIRPEFGRLCPPADPPSLADAINEVLTLVPAERAAMGAAGRRWVLEHCDLATETRVLAGLIEVAGAAAQPSSSR